MVFLRGRAASVPLEGACDLSGFMLGVVGSAGRRFASVAVVAVVSVFWGLRFGGRRRWWNDRVLGRGRICATPCDEEER